MPNETFAAKYPYCDHPNTYINACLSLFQPLNLPKPFLALNDMLNEQYSWKGEILPLLCVCDGVATKKA